jgi:PhnB protein
MGRIGDRCGPLSRSIFLRWLRSSPSHAQHLAVRCYAKRRNTAEATPPAASISRPPEAVQPIPAGYHSVTPWIISRDTAKLLDFMSKAFGAVELGRVYNQDGTIGHAEAKIGDCIVMAFDAQTEWPATPCFLHLYVPDGDAVYQQALAAGATSVTEMTYLAFGDRVGRVRDPFGNLWWIQTRVENLAREEMAQRAAEQPYRDAMQCLQESLDRELRSRKDQ